LQFEIHELSAGVEAHVESIFHYRGFEPDHSIERVVPTGHVFVILELDDIERHTYDNETLEPNASYRKVWVSGLHRNYISISAHQNSEMFVIQFKAFGAHPYLHVPMHEISDKVVLGSEFANANLLRLREEVLAAASSTDKFNIAEKWLADHYQKAKETPAAVVDIVTLLQTEPASKLNEIIKSFSGTQKHLIAQFKKYIGITPKQYQRILRFNDVFARMQGDQFLSWSDIAHLCGYSDQSHFIREFRHFSGFNPKTFLQKEFDVEASNFFPLDRDG